MKANLSRGLFRLWAVLTVLWLAGTLYFAVTDTSIPSLTKGCELLQLGDDALNQCNEVWARERKLLVWQLLGLPLAVMLLAIMLMWVIRGVRLKDGR